MATRDVVLAVASLYEDELQDETCYKYKGLLDGLFERRENAEDVRATIARNM